jgi:hypothetical protein
VVIVSNWVLSHPNTLRKIRSLRTLKLRYGRSVFTPFPEWLDD